MTLHVEWLDAEREPQQKHNPQYPNGIDIDVTNGEPGCQCGLPYPAKRCGWYFIACDVCKSNVLITTAGRADDPRSIRLPCRAVASA